MKELAHPDEIEKLAERLKKRISGDSVPRQYETRIIRKDGSGISVEVNAARTVWQNQPTSIVSVRDISDRKKAEAELLDYQNQLQSLASKLALTEEKERRKVANEIHDRLGQSLAISKIKLSELQKASGSKKIENSLRDIRKIIEKLIEETRDLTFELCPPVLYELGFESALDWLVEQFKNRHNIKIDIKDDGKQKPLNDDVRFVLFGSVRELLINVIKHAKAKHVSIRMKNENGYFQVEVLDDGIGFDASQLAMDKKKNDGFGHFQIRERLKSLDGFFDIKSSREQGTGVFIRLPIK
jgi:signal transduction histidine kinase